MRNWLISTEKKQTEYYDGIEIHADIGLHEQAFEFFTKYVEKGTKVLDIGAGAGAFSKRLYNNGYNVEAIDVETFEWIPKEIPFLKLDLNKGLKSSVNKTYDALCCLEVIEHLENPWGFLREINSITNIGGKLLLTTPNITSFWSRMYFLRSGHFHGFMPYDLSYGHINPLSGYEIELIAKNTGWKVLEIRAGGYLPIFDFSEFKPKLLFSNLFRWIAYIISKGHKKGWVLMFMLEKVDESEIVYKPGDYKY